MNLKFGTSDEISTYGKLTYPPISGKTTNIPNFYFSNQL